MSTPGSIPLPSPGVRFPGDFVARLGDFAARLSAAREREEVGQRRTLEGEGQEFVGHRPYRPGEDMKRVDWDLFARLDRPFVRVQRSEAREDWWIGIDVSASMGVGAPGKLQSAAEAAAASIAVGLRLGAHITLAWQGANGLPGRCVVRRTGDLSAALRALSRLEAAEDGGLERLLEGGGVAAPRRAGRILLFGDFVDVDLRSVLALLGGSRRIHLGQVLAPEEWDPSLVLDRAGSVAWVDPETGDRTFGGGGDASVAAYVRHLEFFIERWSGLARTHRMVHRAWRSDEPFEAHLEDLLR